MQVMIFGAGYSGRAIADTLSRTGARIAGTTRSAQKTAQLAAHGITPFVFDGSALGDDLMDCLRETTHLIQSIAPGETGDRLIELMAAGLSGVMPKLRWVGYLSTVGVYGDHDGAWVDETVTCKPVSQRSIQRLQAERAWRDLAGSSGIPAAILRLSGIYGPGRNAFVNLEKGTARRLIKKGQVFNRIHVDDIAGATGLLARQTEDGIFNITDDEPAPPQDVVTYAAQRMGVAPPEAIAFETAELSPMARSFYGENKRVSNALIKTRGYRFRYPTYRDALDAMWESQTWRPPA